MDLDLMQEPVTERPGATRRRYGRTATGQVTWQALQELRDREDHVIGVGELFTVHGWPQQPACSDCVPVVLA